MRYWKQIRGYLVAITLMCIGLTLTEFILHQEKPSLTILIAGALGGIAIEVIGNNHKQIRTIVLRKAKNSEKTGWGPSGR